MTEVSLFVFGTDLVHEGLDKVLDALRTRAGADDVILSATYHDARDVFPHNPRHRVYRHEGDIAWFHADPGLYAPGFAPKLADAAEGADVMQGLCNAAGFRDMTVSAWTIFLHNSRLASAHPDCATRNVYGDPYLSDLCPANPDVRHYCRSLARDIARYPVARMLAEGLHYRTLEHGEHHERYLIDIPGWARGLMSLCFCRHCRAVAERADIDIERLAAQIRDALAPVWQGATPTGEAALSDAARRDVVRFRQQRRSVVTSLVAEVRAELEPAGIELTFIDHGGAMAHVLPRLKPDADLEAVSADLLGIDSAAVASVCDEYMILGYAKEPRHLGRLANACRENLGPQVRLSVALRPLAIDCADPANLEAKVRAVRTQGASSLAFYHYAMMPLDRLDWIGAAVSAGGPR